MITILVVDDEAPIRDWIVYSIEREKGSDFQVVASARNGKEAYELALQHKPDVVVTDIKMPGMDGIELMQAILEQLPYTGFIILTNYAEFSYARAAMAYGAKHYLLKSELRSADLIMLLQDLNQTKMKIIEGMRTDIYANGFLDVYDLYQHPDDPSFAKEFCLRHGMVTGLPYCILGLRENHGLGQKELLDALLHEFKPQFGIAALQQQVVFLILQDKKVNLLIDKARQIAERFTQSSGEQIAVGHVKHDLEEIVSALGETELLVHALFFHPTQPILAFNRFHHLPAVDRIAVRRMNQEVIGLLESRDYLNTRLALSAWSAAFDNLALEDVLWAKETYLKMVFSLEERLSQVHGETPDCPSTDSGDLTSLQACWRCMLKMLDVLEASFGKGYSRNIQQALSYIRTNYAKQISLMEIAAHVGLSPEYFSRLFKEETGENFSVHLMMYRLNQAQRLLRQTDLKVYEIASAVGYATPSYFSKLYRTYMGELPESARRRNS